MWVGGESTRLSFWNGTKFVTRALTSMPADAGVRSMAFASDGTLWVGTTEGLVEMKDGHERLFTTRDGLADNWIMSLFEGRDGALWVGTRSGFSRLRNGELVSFRPEEGLSQSTVYSVFEDREGSLWVGTKHGLNQFLDGRAIPYTINEGLPSNNTGPVLEDSAGHIWVGTLGAGLSRFDGKKFTVLTNRDGLASNFIYALAEEPDGGLWVGTDHGLSRLWDGRVVQTFTRANGLPSNDIRSLLRDRTGTLWAGTSAGAARLSGGGFSTPKGMAGAAPVVAIGEDGSADLCRDGERRVVAYAGGKSEEILQNGSPLRGVDAFYRGSRRRAVDGQGLIGGGLRLFENGKMTAFLMRDGLFDGDIYGIVTDGQDRMWLACSKGIFSVPRGDLRRFAAGELKKITSTPYSPTDAQRVIECKPGVQPAVSLTHEGRGVVLQTIRRADRAQMRCIWIPWQNVPPPPVVIDDVTVNGERENPAAIGKLAPGQKNLELTYTGLSYLSPGRITFRYILEGFDKDWINAGTRREAYYTNLPPGKFKFLRHAHGYIPRRIVQ